ncbi:MAG TPA: hypothetical protein VK281_19190 [Xanthobacteraceae bacterium]|nr:hypothetical protein [Xanthobacteraceae bacterium]
MAALALLGSRMNQDIVSKAEFARITGVTRARVSQWISGGELDGALVRDGRAERIDVKAARRQLGGRLAVDQRTISRGRGDRGDTIDEIQRERLAALRLTNERARAAALADAGRFLEADAVRVELGRVAGRLVSAFDGVLPEFAAAAATVTRGSERDILHAIRGVWGEARARLAGAEAEAAVLESEVVEASL